MSAFKLLTLIKYCNYISMNDIKGENYHFNKMCLEKINCANKAFSISNVTYRM